MFAYLSVSYVQTRVSNPILTRRQSRHVPVYTNGQLISDSSSVCVWRSLAFRNFEIEVRVISARQIREEMGKQVAEAILKKSFSSVAGSETKQKLILFIARVRFLIYVFQRLMKRKL